MAVMKTWSSGRGLSAPGTLRQETGSILCGAATVTNSRKPKLLLPWGTGRCHLTEDICLLFSSIRKTRPHTDLRLPVGYQCYATETYGVSDPRIPESRAPLITQISIPATLTPSSEE